MNMHSSTRISCLLVIVVTFAIHAFGQSEQISIERVYNDLRTIEGKIMILNHPSLGKTEGRNMQILFQRVDCPTSYVSVRSDSDGNYSLTLSKGRYRLVTGGPKVTNGPYFDLVSPKQRRIVDVSKSKTVVVFDIEIRLPPE